MLTEQEIIQIAQDHIDKSGKNPGLSFLFSKKLLLKKVME